MVQNRGLIFKAVPTGWPVVGEHLAVEDRPFDLDTQPPRNGIITKNCYVSFDPYQRIRMRGPSVKSYFPPFEINKPITNAAVAKVLRSDNDKYHEGEVVVLRGMPTEEYSVLLPELANRAEKLDNPYHLPPAEFLGALGMSGLTAYASLYEIGQPKRGDTIFISAASGAVGQLVGQLAKKEGLTVIGSVGDDKKLKFITDDLDFDCGFNYKKEKPGDALKRLAPDGIDIYYENVGGEHLEAAIDAMKNFGRIIVSGMISQYNVEPSEAYGVKNLMQFVTKRIKMQGFVVGDANMRPKYTVAHQKNMQKWISDGSFKTVTSETDGIENAAEGFVGMLAGKNFGKAVLKIADLNDESAVYLRP